MIELGRVAASSTIWFPFTTKGADGAPLAPSSAFEAADLRIYKNGSSTERTSANGITMTSPFDSVTGLHMIGIDLSDNTDAGFYSDGDTFNVVLIPDETVAGLSVVAPLARFTIGAALADIAAAIGTPSDLGSGATVAANLADIEGQTDDVPAIIGQIDTAIALITSVWQAVVLTDFGNDPVGTVGNDTTHVHLLGLGAEWANDTINGYMLLLVDDSSGWTYATWVTDWDASSELATVSPALPVTPEGGVDLWRLLTSRRDSGLTSAETQSAAAAALTAYDPPTKAELDSAVAPLAIEATAQTIGGYLDTEIAAIKARTDTLPTDPADQSAVEAAITAATSPLATQASVDVIDGNVDLILADTNELQTDWANGGRLDLLLDAAAGGTADPELAVAQSGAASTITLAAAASAVDDYYNGRLIFILKGAGASLPGGYRIRRITDYVGSTRVATVSPAWDGVPDSTSRYLIV